MATNSFSCAARKRVEVELSEAERPFYLGVDVGGTSIKMGLVDDRGRTLAFRQFETEQERGPADAVSRIEQQMQRLLESLQLGPGEIAGLGLGTPGTMDIPTGMILEPPNMPAWRHFPLRDALADRTGQAVTFANDGGAAAYGEFWVGSGAELASVVMLTLGTGVGGGIILGDRSLDGEHSHGAECGHAIIDSSEFARVCSCGKRGHLEAYASATAVIKRATEALEQQPKSSVPARLAAGEELTPLLLAEEAEAGDAFSEQLILETAEYLAIAITTFAHTIDPAGMILGGAMTFGRHQTRIGREFLERVRSGFRQRTFPVLAEKVTIDYAALGGDAGYLGAAGLARAAARST